MRICVDVGIYSYIEHSKNNLHSHGISIMRDLDLHEMEAVSGGFLRDNYKQLLVGEAPPQRFLPAPDTLPPQVSETPAPLAHIRLETEAPVESLCLFQHSNATGFDLNSLGNLFGISRYQPTSHAWAGQEGARPSDLSMARRSRRPDVQSWKTPYLTNR